ncbi:hypothetical protein [Bacillus phage PK1]|nr:hypothetical protein [Bacillus phage PK1]
MDYLSIEESKFLIKSSNIILKDIKNSYGKYVDSPDIPFQLKDRIKEFLSKTSSALEYQAFNIFTTYCKDKIHPEKLEQAERQVYFPNKDYEPAFEKYITSRFPYLIELRPDLVDLIKSVQPFRSNNNKWLSDLNKLNNANKHRNLSKQRRQRKVYIKEGKIGGITFKDSTLVGGEGSIPMIYNGAIIDFENPSIYDNCFDASIEIHFIFNEINKPVIDTLEAINEGTNNFIKDFEIVW